MGRRYKYLPPYLLCLRSQKEVVVAGGIEFPDGETLFHKIKAGKRPSRDESELIFGKFSLKFDGEQLEAYLPSHLVTRDEIPLKLIAQWIKKQQPKGKGKEKVKSNSDLESYPDDSEIESQWTKSDGGDDTKDPILSPIGHRLKRHRINANGRFIH